MRGGAEVRGECVGDYTPTPEDKFAFGMWTIGHPGRDPFGDSTRPPIDPVDYVKGLADMMGKIEPLCNGRCLDVNV